MIRIPGASAASVASRPLPPQLVPVLRGTLTAVILGLSLVALWAAGVRLVPGWLPGEAWPAARHTGGATVALLALFVALLGGLALLSGLRSWEARIEQARAEHYRARAREWQEARREQAEAVATEETEAAPAPDAILLVDLVQSTELIVEQGDLFFRDLLRRIEAAFLPVARQWRIRAINGHGDGLLFCFAQAEDALAALREMYGQISAINQELREGAEIAFRASLHVGSSFADSRGNRVGLAVLKAARLSSVMESLHGRGGGPNSLVLSEEARVALGPAGASARLLGQLSLRGFPGTHAVYQIDV